MPPPMPTLKPKGELCKVQFQKTITVIGKVTFDAETGLFHIESSDMNSWVHPDNIALIEDANQREIEKYERYASPIGERPRKKIRGGPLK